MRRFVLHRVMDISGVSGTGVVAQGVQAEDGTVALNWLGANSSWVIHKSMEAVEEIHGHDGATQIVWVD